MKVICLLKVSAWEGFLSFFYFILFYFIWKNQKRFDLWLTCMPYHTIMHIYPYYMRSLYSVPASQIVPPSSDIKAHPGK